MLLSRLQSARFVSTVFIKQCPSILTITRHRSDTTGGNQKQSESDHSKKALSEHSAPTDTEKESAKKARSMAELDKELREKLEGMSGEGGAAGLEYEDGKPVAMKRSVKNNMFRYI